MPKAQAMIMPVKYFFDKDGNPLAFGKVYTYQAGTTIDKVTYTNENGDIANPNPVILNGEGYANIYLDGSYNIVVDDQNDNNIWTEDPVSSNIAEEWVDCETPVYVSPTSFKISGNVTANYREGYRVRIDNNTSEFSYSTIITSSFSSGETTVTLEDSVVEVGVVQSCVSITGPESINTSNAQIKDLTIPYIFNNVDEMKTSTISFPIGKRLKTNGYYTIGDKGAASYLVLSTQAVDGYGDHSLASGNIAKLQYGDNVAKYGAVGEGDHTDNIQAANDSLNIGSLSFNANDPQEVAGTLTLNKKIKAPLQYILNITGTLSLEGSARTIKSLWFSDDPWDSMVIASEMLAAHKGGTVYVKDAVYNADKPLLISSESPVNLLGSMWTSGQQSSDALIPESYITPKSGLLATDNIIEYSGDGGGKISGLFFIDDNDIDNPSLEDKRVIAFGAAIKLTEWNLSKLSECNFTYLKASAIETGSCTMSSIKDIWVRRSGRTGFPPINLKNTAGSFSAQSFELSSVRCEVNYNETYIELGSQTTKCKISNIGFEADQAEANTNQTFLKNEGSLNQFDLFHLNRNTALKAVDTGTDNIWTNINAATSGDNGVLHSTGANFILADYSGKNNTNAQDEILVEGTDAKLSNIVCNTGGGIRCTAAGAVLSNITIVAIQDCLNGAIELANSSALSGARIRGSVALKHLVYLATSSNAVNGVIARDVPSGFAGIYAAAPGWNAITGNTITAPGGSTGIDTSSSSNNAVMGNTTQGGGTDYSLSGSDVTTGNV